MTESEDQKKLEELEKKESELIDRLEILNVILNILDKLYKILNKQASVGGEQGKPKLHDIKELLQQINKRKNEVYDSKTEKNILKSEKVYHSEFKKIFNELEKKVLNQKEELESVISNLTKLLNKKDYKLKIQFEHKSQQDKDNQQNEIGTVQNFVELLTSSEFDKLDGLINAFKKENNITWNELQQVIKERDSHLTKTEVGQSENNALKRDDKNLNDMQ